MCGEGRSDRFKKALCCRGLLACQGDAAPVGLGPLGSQAAVFGVHGGAGDYRVAICYVDGTAHQVADTLKQRWKHWHTFSKSLARKDCLRKWGVRPPVDRWKRFA